MKKLNHYYFNTIDSEYKAYILGFIYADGSINISREPLRNKKGEIYKIRERKRLSISIQERDGYVLNQLATDLNVNLNKRNPPSSIKRGWQSQIRLAIFSDEIFENLVQLGCFENKSKIGMIFPNIKEEFIPHFIRGFFDGDGSIGIKIRKNNYIRKTSYTLKNPGKSERYTLRLTLSSTCESFLKKIESILVDKTGCNFSFEKKNNCINMICYSSEGTKRICDYLYTNSSIYLERKKNKVIEFDMLIKSQAENKFSEGLETT